MASSTVRLRLFLEPVIDVVGAVVRQVVHDDVPIPNGIANVDDTLASEEPWHTWPSEAPRPPRQAHADIASRDVEPLLNGPWIGSCGSNTTGASWAELSFSRYARCCDAGQANT
jgi:hypothetical protein